MANGFDYESPINRLLGVTIPQFIEGQLDRQENRRRFDEQIAFRREEANRQQANLDKQLEADAAERAESKRRFGLQYQQNKESLNYQKTKDKERETYDNEFRIVDQISNIGSYDRRIERANKLKESGAITDQRVLSNLDAIIESSSGIKKDREIDLQTALESGVIDQKSFDIMQSKTGISDSAYNQSYQTVVANAIDKQSQPRKLAFEELKALNKQITYLSGEGMKQARILEATQPGAVQDVENQISQLQSQKQSMVQMLSAGSPSLGAGEYSPQYQSAINKVFRQEDLSTEDIGTLSAEEIEDLERFMLSNRDSTQAPPEEEKPQLDFTQPFELSVPTPEEAPSKMNIPSGEFAEQPLTAGRLRKIITSEFNKQRVAEARGIDVAPSQEYQFVTMLARQLGFDSAEDLNSQAGIKALREYYR